MKTKITKQMKEFKQNGMKPVKETGSFVNMMMSRNGTLPEVGKGATVLMYSDRHAYEVLHVSEDRKECVIRPMGHKPAPGSASMSNEYVYFSQEDAIKEVVRWRYGKWMRKYDNGYTEKWEKVNIIFGIMEEYYDFTR